MPKGTKLQNLRCDDELWNAAGGKLAAAGTDRSAAVRGYLTAIAAADPQRVAEILAAFPPK